MAPSNHPATDDDRPHRLIGFGRDEVAGICGALALGASLLRRLGLGAESTRLEALFDVVEATGWTCALRPLGYLESEEPAALAWPPSCS